MLAFQAENDYIYVSNYYFDNIIKDSFKHVLPRSFAICKIRGWSLGMEYQDTHIEMICT